MEMIKEEIYDLFKKLTQQAQITSVAQLIGMPNDFRPSNYMNLYAAKTAIVDWAETQPEKLKELKHIIIFVTDDKANKPKYTEILCSLNCKQQRKMLEQTLKSKLGGAFLLQADDETVQLWLMKCLIDYTKNYIKDKKYYNYTILQLPDIKVSKLTKYNFFDSVLSDFSQKYNINIDNDVIEQLINLGKTKSIIFTMYQFQSIDESNKRKFYEFWVNLWQSFTSKNKNSLLVLLLVEKNNNDNDKLIPFNFMETDYQTNISIPSNILIPPLTRISQEDMTQWLKMKEVDSIMKSIYQDTFVRDCVRNRQDWLYEDPGALIEQICKSVFNMKEGIPEIERDLKLEAL